MTPAPITPVFIFSVSRSGSTLLQRVIGAHTGVATVSEPWLLLSHAYTLRRAGIDAEYSHPQMVDAIADFCAELPAGPEDYREELHDFALRLYRKAAGPQARFFIDKSPPYCLIAAEIMRLFPEAKFIFLWRNPLSIVASVIRTWEPWRPTLFPGDLFTGLPRLVAARSAAGPAAYSVRFEDLLAGEQEHWAGLMGYLEIPFEPDALERFAEVKLNGRTGDPTGVSHYSKLSAEPREKWKVTLANPLRREWSRRYLSYLGDERLAVMGYCRELLVHELDAQPSSTDSLISDIGRLLTDVAKEPLRVHTRGRKLSSPNVIRALLKRPRPIPGASPHARNGTGPTL